MSTTDAELPDPELGTASIVYERPDGERETLTVDNECIVYFGDHWQVRTGEDDDGNDVVRRIPREQVYYVERSVEEFKDRVETAIDRAKEQLGLS